MKGKDMILSDFLSRQEKDKSDPHELIPISFNMKTILNDRYYIWFKHDLKLKIVELSYQKYMEQRKV